MFFTKFKSNKDNLIQIKNVLFLIMILEILKIKIYKDKNS